MPVSGASFAYPEADTTTRAAIASRLAETLPAEGLFVLSTCLRIEVAAPVTAPVLEAALTAALDGRAAPPPRWRSGVGAVEHLYRVAAGLESPVLGEREILGQYRKAVSAAAEQSGLEPTFVKLLQAGVDAARRARRVLPDRPHDSLGAVAAELVAGAERVAVLGAGDMAAAVLRHLRSDDGGPEVVVLARRPERVRLDAEVVPFDRMPQILSEYPAVISATSASGGLVATDELAVMLRARRMPLTLVDLSMPPDFQPPPGLAVTYHDIDGIAGRARPHASTAEAEALVAEAAAKSHGRFEAHDKVGPVVGKLMSDADALVAATVDRYASRLSDPADIAVLQQAAHTVARSLLARPVAHLNRSGTDLSDIEAIDRAFAPDRG